MPGKIGKIRLGHLRITAVFRHQWDSPEIGWYGRHQFKNRQLGVFWKKHLCVGTAKEGKNMFDKDNLYPSYMIGLYLIWAKCWIEVSWKVLELTTD
jgi:hypothetical protein